MATSPEAEAIIAYLKGTVLRNPTIEIGEDTPLVSSGLMDSMALIDVLLQVEKVTGRRIPAGKVGAKDMDTVTLMLATAARVGVERKPR